MTTSIGKSVGSSGLGRCAGACPSSIHASDWADSAPSVLASRRMTETTCCLLESCTLHSWGRSADWADRRRFTCNDAWWNGISFGLRLGMVHQSWFERTHRVRLFCYMTVCRTSRPLLNGKLDMNESCARSYVLQTYGPLQHSEYL